MGARYSSALLWTLLAAVAAAEAEDADVQSRIAARIDGETVTWGEVELELRRAIGEKELPPEQRGRLRQAALDQVIDRRLVLRYLARTSQAASDQDVDFALARFEKDLSSRGLTLEEHLKQLGIGAEDFRQTLAWQISWDRYLGKQLTDANLEKYFERHRREFDGTELRVAQILFKLSADADEAVIAGAKEKAAQMKQQIDSGEMSFADAARQHSQSPSAERGGDIGWIERHKPMPEDFSRTAYSLQPGQISDPLVSRFGVHVITVLEEKPGQRTWRDAAAELRPAVALYLFRWIADRERGQAKIERMP